MKAEAAWRRVMPGGCRADGSPPAAGRRPPPGVVRPVSTAGPGPVRSSFPLRSCAGC